MIVQFVYRNHHEKIETRTVAVESVEYITEPGFDYEPGWFLSGFCLDREARRSFAFDRMVPKGEPDRPNGTYTLLSIEDRAYMMSELVKHSERLAENVIFDEHGKLVAGMYQGGNGGIISEHTLVAADNLIKAIEKAKALEQYNDT